MSFGTRPSIIYINTCDDAAHDGHEEIMVKTADTDVVVIIVSMLHNIPASEIWISFGVGKHHLCPVAKGFNSVSTGCKLDKICLQET